MFDGRPWPQAGEPLWTEEDRRDALALAAEEAEECPGCGGQVSETTDPDNEFRYEAHAARCHRCNTQQRELRSYGTDGDPTGMLVVATLEQ